MRFVSTRSNARRLPRWAPLVIAAAALLVATQLVASVRRLASTHQAQQPRGTAHPTAALGGRTSQQSLGLLSGTPLAQLAAVGGNGAGSTAGGWKGRRGREGTPPPLPPGTMTCKASGYCSLGKTRVWKGDIATNAALRDMLQATSFETEIIIVPLQKAGGVWAGMTINLVRSAEDLGLGHIAMLAVDEQVCRGLPAAFQHTTCMWDTRPGANGTGVSNLAVFWAKRWEAAARILRMGYNVMVVDSDAMFHHDPYVFLKSKPLSEYHLLFQKDAPDGYFGAGINCGMFYWQNVHPSGPSVWAAVEHADRTFRQREAVEEMQRVYTGWDAYNFTWDQGTWNDMLLSLDSGEPRYTAVANVANDEWREVMDPEVGMPRMVCKPMTWPPEWFNVTGISPGSDTPLCELRDLRLPRPKSTSWWRQHGHLYYPQQRGPRSQAFMQLVREASDQPLAELDDPGWQAPAAPLPPEHAAFLPTFFAGAYIFRAAHFFALNTPPPQVFSHLVYIYTDKGRKDWKPYVFKGLDMWHWEVTEEFIGGSVLGRGDPRLLMLAPGVHLLTDTEQAFRDELNKLIVLAQALGRRLVVPPVPCDSRWVGLWVVGQAWAKLFPNLTRWERTYDAAQVLQFPDHQRPGKSFCQWNRDLSQQCIAKLIPHVDAVAFLERSLTPQQAAPSESNTLWHKQWTAAGGAAAEPGASIAVPTTLEAAAEAAARFSAEPVLFLGALPRLEGAVPEPPVDFLEACELVDASYFFEVDEETQKARQAQLAAAAGTAR